MRTLTFCAISDPGHGWAKVKMTLLVRLLGPGWRNHFTSCSFERNGHAYLEEDEDASRFALLLKHHGIEPIFRTANCASRQSCVRNYPPLDTNFKYGDPTPRPDARYP